MYNRWFSVAVVMLWLSTMSWLVVTKIIPPLLIGNPPNHRTILAAQRSKPPVAWTMEIDGKQMGWALCKVVSLPDNLTEVRSRVHFDEFPQWLRIALKFSDRPSSVGLDAESKLTIDALGRLSSIDSLVRLEPVGNLIHLDGTIEENLLKWQVRSGTFLYKDETYLPADALMGDALSPQTHLPGLRVGQTWTVPAYSFWPPNNPIEILQATVDRSEPMSYNGRVEEVWVVVYRSDPGSGLTNDAIPRQRLWVRRDNDGTVLRQQVRLFSATIVFTRLPNDEAIELENRVERSRPKQLGEEQPQP